MLSSQFRIINMRSSFGCRYWSLLQVVVIVVCCRGIALSEVAQDCVGSQLMLSCPKMKVIQITAVVLGNFKCPIVILASSCCINDSYCTVHPNEDHRRDVHRRCDNKRSCTVDVHEEEIDCGFFGPLFDNDFERITYDCKDEPRNKTMNSTEHSPGSESTVTSYVEHTTKQDHSSILTTAGRTFTLYNDTKAGEQAHQEPAAKEPSLKVIPIVVGIIGLIILLAVVALVVAVVVHQRKKSALRKLSPKIDNHQHETDVHATEIQETSQHKSSYALVQKVDEADFLKAVEDQVVYSEVEQRTTVWSEGQNLAADQGTQLTSDEGPTVIENDLYNHKSEGQGQTADKTGTAHNTQMVGSDAYEVVGEPSKSVSSVFKTDQIGTKGIANMENRSSDNIYELESNDMEDIYVSDSAADPGKHLVADGVLNISMPQDGDGQTVIENALYSQ